MITFKTHSIVDIITNSSTVIYTWASGNAEEMVFELIDEVLSASGSDKKARDLYSVDVRVSRGSVESHMEVAIDDGEDEELLALYNEGCGADKRFKTWTEHWNALLDHFIKNIDHDELMQLEDYNGFTPETEIVVTRKDGKETAIDKILGSLFHSEASYG